jgi:hypothetical protein
MTAVAVVAVAVVAGGQASVLRSHGKHKSETPRGSGKGKKRRKKARKREKGGRRKSDEIVVTVAVVVVVAREAGMVVGQVGVDERVLISNPLAPSSWVWMWM